MPALPPGLRDEDLLQRLELLDALAGAHRHGQQRLLGDVHGHAGLVPDPLVEAAEQGDAALTRYSTLAGIALCVAIFIYIAYITRRAVNDELEDDDGVPPCAEEERAAFLGADDNAGMDLDLEAHMAETPLRATFQLPGLSSVGASVDAALQPTASDDKRRGR